MMARSNRSKDEWIQTTTQATSNSSTNISIKDIEQINWRQLCIDVAGIKADAATPIQRRIMALADTTLPNLFPDDATQESKEIIQAEALFEAVHQIANDSHKLIDNPSEKQTQHHHYFLANQALWLDGLNSTLFRKLRSNKTDLKNLPNVHFGAQRLHPPIEDNTSLYQSLLMAFFAYTFAVADFTKIRQVKTSSVQTLFLKTLQSNAVKSKAKCLQVLAQCKHYTKATSATKQQTSCDPFANITLTIENEACIDNNDSGNTTDCDSTSSDECSNVERQTKVKPSQPNLSIRQQIAAAVTQATLEDNHQTPQPLSAESALAANAKKQQFVASTKHMLDEKLNAIEQYLIQRKDELPRFHFFYSRQDYENRQSSFNSIKTLFANATELIGIISEINRYHVPRFAGRTCCSSRRYQRHLQDLVNILNNAYQNEVTLVELSNATTMPDTRPRSHSI